MNLDKTFCISPNCKNDCGRKLPEQYKEYAKTHFLSMSYFCDQPEWYSVGEKVAEKYKSALKGLKDK